MNNFIPVKTIRTIVQNYGSFRVWIMDEKHTDTKSKLRLHQKKNKHIIMTISKEEDEITVTLTNETGFIVKRDWWDCTIEPPSIYNTMEYTQKKASVQDIYSFLTSLSNNQKNEIKDNY